MNAVRVTIERDLDKRDVKGKATKEAKDIPMLGEAFNQEEVKADDDAVDIPKKINKHLIL